MKPTLVVDSAYLGHRAIYTTGKLSHNDLYTGVIYGFLKQVKHFGQMFRTNDFVFAWDSKYSKRKDIYPSYKENRDPDKYTDQEKEEREQAYRQFDLLREKILPGMGFKNIFQVDGYEADDIICLVVSHYKKDFIIISSDHDLFQLLDFADMYIPKGNGTMITFDSFVKEWGIYPEDWSYVKAIAGCSSDNVQGVYGVGDPTAAKYLSKKMKVTSKKYQDIERALNDGLLSTNLPLVRLPFEGIEIKDCMYRPNKLNYNAFLDICEQYHFLSFLDKNNSDFHGWKEFFKGY